MKWLFCWPFAVAIKWQLKIEALTLKRPQDHKYKKSSSQELPCLTPVKPTLINPQVVSSLLR